MLILLQNVCDNICVHVVSAFAFMKGPSSLWGWGKIRVLLGQKDRQREGREGEEERVREREREREREILLFILTISALNSTPLLNNMFLKYVLANLDIRWLKDVFFHCFTIPDPLLRLFLCFCCCVCDNTLAAITTLLLFLVFLLPQLSHM